MAHSWCLVCGGKYFGSSNQVQATRASGSNIVDLLEAFLGYPLDPTLTESRTACDGCLERFNEFDDAMQTAKRAQAKLTKMYLDSRASQNERESKDNPKERVYRMDVSNKQKGKFKVKHRDIKSHAIVCKCSEEFDSNISYTRHTCPYKEHLWICDICNNTYQSKKSLRLHLGVHSGTSRSFACRECGKLFTQRGHMKRHGILHSGEKLFQCDICGKQFLHVSSYRIHMADHLGNARKKECPVCGMKLLSNSHLDRHMRVHTGDKPFSCGACDRKFAQKYNMVSHMKKTHPNYEVAVF